MTILIEFSDFVDLSSDSPSGAIYDVSNDLIILCCSFLRVTCTIGGGENVKCGAGIFKQNGLLNLSLSSFDRCRYSAGTNNKGGNAVYISNASSKFCVTSILKCSDQSLGSGFGDSAIRLDDNLYTQLRSLNFSQNCGVETGGGNSALEINSLRSEEYNPMDATDCIFSEGKAFRVIYCVTASSLNYTYTRSAFVKNEFSMFFETSGSVFTFCCIFNNSKISLDKRLFFLMCSSDNRSLNSNLYQCYDFIPDVSSLIRAARKRKDRPQNPYHRCILMFISFVFFWPWILENDVHVLYADGIFTINLLRIYLSNFDFLRVL